MSDDVLRVGSRVGLRPRSLLANVPGALACSLIRVACTLFQEMLPLFDVGVVVSFGRLIPDPLLRQLPLGAVNMRG